MKNIPFPDSLTIPSSPWNAAKAARVLQMQARSGLSVAAFARQHGVAPQNLYAWRRRLPQAHASREEVHKVTFLPVEVAKQTATPRSDPASVEVVLPGGTLVRVKGAVDLAQMTAILRAVQAATC